MVDPMAKSTLGKRFLREIAYASAISRVEAVGMQRALHGSMLRAVAGAPLTLGGG